MKTTPTASETDSRIALRGVHCELTEDLNAAVVDRASQLLKYNGHIENIDIEIEQERHSDEDCRYVAKARVEFGGPALLMSVSDRNARRAVDYLFEKLTHQLSRQRRLTRGTTEREPEARKIS